MHSNSLLNSFPLYAEQMTIQRDRVDMFLQHLLTSFGLEANEPKEEAREKGNIFFTATGAFPGS